MDAASFERVYDSLQEFHAFFAASFGRKQWRDHSGNYLQALLVQDQERRNAENLSESVGISARAMQRFLTEARWSDETVIGRLQEYLAPRLGHPEAVWVFDGSDFPKQGRKSAGVARQYCGRLGKVANCQGGMFLAYVSPLGRALVDKRLYLPKSWTSDQDRCAAAGVPEDRRNYRSKTELALEMLERVLELGYLRAEWVAGDDAFGMSPTFREGLAALGMRYVLDVPGGTTVWPLDPAWTSPEYPGFGRPRKPKLRPGQRRTMEQRGDELPDEAWREITVAQEWEHPDPGVSQREQRARERVEQALDLLPQAQATKEGQERTLATPKRDQVTQSRVSTTDPQARVVKMPDGGFRPAYNVELATDRAKGIIVGVSVIREGTDAGQALPMEEQVVKRTGQHPQDYLMDGGFATREDITALEERNVTVYSPVRLPRNKPEEEGYQPHYGDTPQVARWRQRMATEEAKAVYLEVWPESHWPGFALRQSAVFQS